MYLYILICLKYISYNQIFICVCSCLLVKNQLLYAMNLYVRDNFVCFLLNKYF